MCRFAVIFISFIMSLLAPLAHAADIKPTPLNVNTSADEDEPHLSSQGTTLLYASNAGGKSDIYLARRRSPGQPWSAGKPIDGYVSTEADDRSTFLTADGRFPQYLYFATKKDKASENFDIYAAQRIGADKEFSAPTPLNTVASEADELHPWLSDGGRSLYFSRKTKDGWRVFLATRKETTGAAGFGEPTLVKELPPDFHHATLTPDGKTMYLQGPIGDGRWGLFRSARAGATWSKPQPLEGLNHPQGKRGDLSPGLSRDGGYLFFASDRPGGKGGLDLYSVPTRQLAK